MSQPPGQARRPLVGSSDLTFCLGAAEGPPKRLQTQPCGELQAEGQPRPLRLEHPAAILRPDHTGHRLLPKLHVFKKLWLRLLYLSWAQAAARGLWGEA